VKIGSTDDAFDMASIGISSGNYFAIIFKIMDILEIMDIRETMQFNEKYFCFLNFKQFSISVSFKIIAIIRIKINRNIIITII